MENFELLILWKIRSQEYPEIFTQEWMKAARKTKGKKQQGTRRNRGFGEAQPQLTNTMEEFQSYSFIFNSINSVFIQWGGVFFINTRNPYFRNPRRVLFRNPTVLKSAPKMPLPKLPSPSLKNLKNIKSNIYLAVNTSALFSKHP